MGYYNIFYIIRNIVYNFRRIFKYLSICLLSLCFIVICLLLMSTKSSAYTETVMETFSYDSRTYECYLPSAVYATIQTLPEYTSGNYNWFCFSLGSGAGEMGVQFIPKTYDVKYYLTSSLGYSGGRWVYFSLDYSPNSMSGCTYYNIRENNGVLFSTANNTILTSGRFYAGNTRLLMYTEFPLYSDNTFSELLVGEPPVSFIEPVFINAEDSNWGNSLVTGEFNYFFIDFNDAELVSFEIRDITLISQNYGTDFDSWYQIFNLFELHQYCYDTVNNKYAIPKWDLINGYFNDHEYQFVLAWQEGEDTNSKDWTITTDFSQSTIINNEEQQKNNMEQDISSINNFLNDNGYNSSSITDQMPSTNIPDPTETQVNNIFNMIRNAFSTSNAQDIVFSVPNTNQDITIPANLVSSHIPQPILILIQGFYWFLICRFIIKDISKTVEHAKSGEILDAKDGNIKTDLL